MNEKKEIKSNGVHDADRRRFLRNSAAIAGAAAVVPSIAIAKKNKVSVQLEEPSAGYDAQQQFIKDVLSKYAAKSKRVDKAHINAFARGFVEQNGDQNYQEIFKGLHGEYKLVKLFMKSMTQSPV